jgi:hypothetical protein
MNLIAEIRARVAEERFKFSRHASDQGILRSITVSEICEVIADGEVIEDYPNDKYGPSCLIFGMTAAGRPIHVQCSYPAGATVKFITVYEPDPIRWIEFRKRRRQGDAD